MMLVIRYLPVFFDIVIQLVRIAIEHGVNGFIDETPGKNDTVFKKVFNILIGTNYTALLAASGKARKYGYVTSIISSHVTGEAREAAKVLYGIAQDIKKHNTPIKKPACVIAGGETTVTLRGKGKGGRNQELALAFAIAINDWEKIAFISAGTDGTDGPTDAAGAIVDGLTCRKALQANLNPYSFLTNNDSNSFFGPLGDLLKTGPTRTNVMDIMCIIVEE